MLPERNVQRNLIRSFLALRPLDEMDHPIKKPAPRLGRQPDDQPIRQDPRAAGDRAPIPPDSRITGALSPVMAALARPKRIPSITSPSAG